jgi:hypothetical protein
MLAGEDPCDRAAERVSDEDVGARYISRLQQRDEVVAPVLRTGRLGHRVAAAESQKRSSMQELEMQTSVITSCLPLRMFASLAFSSFGHHAWTGVLSIAGILASQKMKRMDGSMPTMNPPSTHEF